MKSMGTVITFYSYKGGVGRSMCLANTGLLLSRWGFKVLLVDWDLEAPGLENFFQKIVRNKFGSNKGLIDLISEASTDEKTIEAIDHIWKSAVSKIVSNGTGTLDLITAGKRETDKSGKFGDEYYKKVRQFDIKNFYEEKRGGEIIEKLRTSWKQEYDFVLIDSRTGITEIGGICTIQLPDILVLLFTATEASFNGIADVAKRAKDAQTKLKVERLRLLTLPILCRIDGSEKELTKFWIDKFIEGAETIPNNLKEIYNNWLPGDIEIPGFVNQTKIPHVAFYSFGETLPVEEDNFETDVQGIGYSYQSIAGLLATGLNFPHLLKKDRTKLLKLGNKNYLDKIKSELFLKIADEIALITKHDVVRHLGTNDFSNSENRDDGKLFELLNKSFESLIGNSPLNIATINTIKKGETFHAKNLETPDLMESAPLDTLTDHIAIRIYYRIKNTDPDYLSLLQRDLSLFITEEVLSKGKSLTSHFTWDKESKLPFQINFYYTNLAKNICDKLNYLLNDKKLVEYDDEIVKYIVAGDTPKLVDQIAKPQYKPFTIQRAFKIGLPIIIVAGLAIWMTLGRKNNSAEKYLMAFNDSLQALKAKTGIYLNESICSLSDYPNIYEDDYIDKTKDSLKNICAVYSGITTNNEIIDKASAGIVSYSDSVRKVNIIGEAIDSKEKKILENNALLASFPDDATEKRRLQNQNLVLQKSVDSIVSIHPIFRETSPANELIQQYQLRVDSANSVSSNITSSETRWFKENYFVLFDELKILLVSLDKAKTAITVDICVTGSAGSCKYSIGKPQITVERPYKFTYANQSYNLYLNRIGRGGKNPFTPAAYITLTKL